MPKGKQITDWVRTQIAVAYNEYREEKAEFIRQVASQRCGRELGLSTVQRELAKLRKEHPQGSTNPLDDQWSLASLTKYPVESRDIPFLLYIQSTFDANTPEEIKQLLKRKGYSTQFLTNRMAIWLSRFIRLAHTDPRATDDKKKSITPEAEGKNPHKWLEWVDDIVHIAMFYSNYEIGCELAHIKPINTIYFDAPTLGQIKLNILMYHQGILKEIISEAKNKADLIEKFQSIDAKDFVLKGGKHARPHNKKG
jgi:hypothetical protein